MKTFIKIHPISDASNAEHYKDLKTVCENYTDFSYVYLQKKSWKMDIKKGFTYKGYWMQKIEFSL